MGTKMCSKCKTINGGPYCTKCGNKTVEIPKCNWDWEKLYPYMTHCPGCGRTKYEALNTSPPPISDQISDQIKQWFSGLFKKTESK